MTLAPQQAASIRPFFEAESVAIVGASERAGSLGAALVDNALAAGFAGAIRPVNPRHARVRGLECAASVADLDAPVDLAVIATPAPTVPAILDACGARGVKAAVILSAGFREAGNEGRALEQTVVATAKRHGIRFIGPNCLGIMRPAIRLNATFSRCMAQPGHVALVSQSGAVCTAMLDWAAAGDVGFSCVVSSGSAADVDFGEILDYLVTDPVTRAIMLYVEGIRDARRFMSALRAASRAKPVVAMKAGRHAEGRRAAVSHTGALVGLDDVFEAALGRSGVVRVHRYADFFAVAETLHAGVRTRGPRLAIVTNGGGPGIIAADAAADKGLPLAQLSEASRTALDGLLPRAWSHSNPVDVLGDASAGRYAAAVRACLDDPGVDAVLAILVPLALTDPLAVAEALAELPARTPKLLLTCWMGDASVQPSRELFRRRGIASYATPETAIEAFAAAAAYRANQELLLQVPEPQAQAAPDRDAARRVIAAALAAGRRVLDAMETKAVLGAFGIPVVPSAIARDADEAGAVAARIGFPVAMKIHSRDITHKSDVDGVRLGIDGVGGVRATFAALLAAAREKRPDAAIEGVLVEPMHTPRGGRELMLGVVADPVFGPAISVGLGGTMVEVLADRAVGLPPLNRFLVRRMIDGTRAARYLEPFRGRPAANRDALEDAILRLSELVCELPWLAELDVNPFVVDERGAVALDARAVVRPVDDSASAYAHMAIHPYPRQLVAQHVLADGTRIMIRPIRPEDAVLEREFVNGLSERARYLRFMHSLKEITPPMVSRFTQIDYDREMALVAIAGESADEREVGVARYVGNADGRGCEFAIVVADAWQGRGIATELLRRLIAVARARRFELMEGIVLAQNRGMLVLAEELGFATEPVPDDASLVRVTLRL